MVDVKSESEQKVRAFLIGDVGDDLRELIGLIETLEMELAGQIILTRREIKPAYGMGTGKAQEISNAAKNAQADCIIFDFDIEPTKQRNWEKLAGIPVFDRQEVILRIFAARAQTREATLQVELARLVYSLPRLAHSYGDMARQRGGNYGAKGSGETQLELDARRVREKIAQVKRELLKVEQNRQTQHKKRQKDGVPTCALVGYTNAGKSSLMNALTGADVLVENKLFATLDPTTRRINLQGRGAILFTDTVGFISNLPHTLIDAFKSTLAEAAEADLQLLILDASSENCLFEYESVCKVLKEIGADKSQRVILLNKADLVKGENADDGEQNFASSENASASEENVLCVQNPATSEINSFSEQNSAASEERSRGTRTSLSAIFPDAIWTSAKTRDGLDILIDRVMQILLK